MCNHLERFQTNFPSCSSQALRLGSTAVHARTPLRASQPWRMCNQPRKHRNARITASHSPCCLLVHTRARRSHPRLAHGHHLAAADASRTLPSCRCSFQAHRATVSPAASTRAVRTTPCVSWCPGYTEATSPGCWLPRGPPPRCRECCPPWNRPHVNAGPQLQLR